MPKHLSHSWGTSAKQKRREKEYNREYYLKNKDKRKRYNVKDNVSDTNETPLQTIAVDITMNAIDKATKSHDEYLEIEKNAELLKNKNAAAFNEASRAGELAYKRYLKDKDAAINVAVASTAVMAGEAAVTGIIDFVSDLSKPAWKR